MFEVFLPQLLLYPNASDPLNGEAAALMMRDRTAYEQRVKGIHPFQESWILDYALLVLLKKSLRFLQYLPPVFAILISGSL